MRLIIPMAGEGKRLRPHTLTVPKPLFPLLGKPVLQWLIEEIQRALPGTVERMVFIVRDLRVDHQRFLEHLAESFGAAAYFCEQTQPLGTAHAIYQAREHLAGGCVILFADTIFKASIHVPQDADGALWVKRVEDPRSYGVVELSPEGFIHRLIEKPETPPSDLAIIGIYYLRQAERLLPAIEYLFQHNIQSKGEYQLTDALQWLCDQGVKLRALPVQEWLDCGSKSLILQAQTRLLELGEGQHSSQAALKNVHVIPPCHIADDAEVSDSILGPYVVVEKGAKVRRSIITRTLCRTHSQIEESILHDTIIGAYAYCKGALGALDLGDYSRYG